MDLMADYELRILERHGDLIAVVPFSDLTYSRGLRGSGRCQATIPLDHPSIEDPLTLHPWAREVMLRRRETPGDEWVVAHDGPITDLQYDVDGGHANITAGTLKAFLTKREGGQYFFVEDADLGDIADLIITRAQDRGLDPLPAGSSFSCDHTPVTTGVTRLFDTTGQGPRKYNDILDEYANGDPGFDYEFVTTYTAGGTRTREFVVHYPKQGSDSPIPLILGGGLVSLKVTVDGDRAATHYNVYGTSKGFLTKVSNTFVDDTIIDVYTRLEEAETRSDIDDLDRLHDISLEQLRLRTPPIYLPAATYLASAQTPWRFAGPGDTVFIKASRGPVQFNERRRMVNETVSVSADGAESIQLEFNDPVSDS